VIVGQKDGFAYALTARHVLNGRPQFDVLVRQGDDTERFSQARVLADAADSDLALITFPTGNAELPSLTLAPKSPDLKKFPLPILNAGWQEERGPTALEDAALDRKLVRNGDGTSAFFWETTTPSQKGRSGGPLVSRDGSLIGVCSGNQGAHGYFTHRDEIHYFLRKQPSSRWLVEKTAKP
jgi:S1-C subfamily serine protease